ncbi:helix-turn-helix domain-containing protein [Escherichia coli]|nr:helix-turn-helix domain-containing protein [Klebsiella variicola]
MATGPELDQERAAAELGISRTSLVKYEDGETVPGPYNLPPSR